MKAMRGARPWVAATLGVLALGPGTGAARAQFTAGTEVLAGRDLPVDEYVLDNGMRFLLLPRVGPPTVSFVVHFAVGSVNDPPGQTGISHFVEHLLFKGTTTIGTTNLASERALFARMDAAHDSLLVARSDGAGPDTPVAQRLRGRIEALEDSARALTVANEFSQIFRSAGGRDLNAVTSYEATQYFVELPANRAELWFAMEGDRMRNPVFREFFTERDVIAEERRTRVDASPGARLYEAHLDAAFPVHPYGTSPTGRMEDILSLSRPVVREHFDRFYGPNNAVVSIVGDFDADSARVWADRYFGTVPASEPVRPVAAREPEQVGERRIELILDAQPQLRIGWKIPSGVSPEAPTLSVLANLLVAGRDTRLYRRLIRDDRIATSVTASGGPGTLYPGLFTIHAVPRAPHTVEEVEAAIYQEMARLLEEPPTEDELERVRTRLEAGEVRGLVSNQGLALQLANSEAVWGDWREAFARIDRMREVDAADVVEVVERFFVPAGRTVAVLKPEPLR